jgi:hypothetical protein
MCTSDTALMWLKSGPAASGLLTQNFKKRLCRCRFTHLKCRFYPQDRVLRYPDGHVRTIRYPSPDSQEYSEPEPSAVDADVDAAGSAAPAWRICGDNDISCGLIGSYDTDSTLPGAAPVGDLWADETHAQGQAAITTPAAPKTRAGSANELRGNLRGEQDAADGEVAHSRARREGSVARKLQSSVFLAPAFH